MHFLHLATATSLAALLPPANAQAIFHGTSVLITPSRHIHHPANSTLQTSNFYCYFTQTGYLSFGWWLGGDPNAIDSTPCTPSPAHDAFDWFEYSSGGCNESVGACRFRAVNYHAWDPVVPAFEEDYVVMPLQLGPTEREVMFLSYFDRLGGGSAVGVRKSLESGEQCESAYRTLKNLVKEHDLPVSFEMENPCARSKSRIERLGQNVLNLGPMPRDRHGL